MALMTEQNLVDPMENLKVYQMASMTGSNWADLTEYLTVGLKVCQKVRLLSIDRKEKNHDCS